MIDENMAFYLISVISFLAGIYCGYHLKESGWLGEEEEKVTR